jgi:hypothetical protein
VGIAAHPFTRWLLGIAGGVGLVCAVATVPVTMVQYGHRTIISLSLAMRLGDWVVGAPPAGMTLLVAGFLGALLLLVARWPIKAYATIALAWFVFAQSAFRADGRWAQQMSQTFDTTPFYVGALVTAAVLLVLALLALITAVFARGAVQARGTPVHGRGAPAPDV